MNTLVERRVVTVADLIGALRSGEAPRTIQRPRLAQSSAELGAIVGTSARVVAIGAHPGAGTSVVSMALADALAASRQVTSMAGPLVVDGAALELSGMSGASECEVQGTETGWRTGRRGTVTVLWPEVSPGSPDQVPAFPAPTGRPVVIDAGWAWRAVMYGAGPVREWLDFAELVVVCRATIPGVRQVELALEQLPGEPLVAAVGARRWPGVVRASFGPRLAEIVEHGGTVLVPSDRRVKVNGVEAGPFPRPVAAAAADLALALEARWRGGACEASGGRVSE